MHADSNIDGTSFRPSIRMICHIASCEVDTPKGSISTSQVNSFRMICHIPVGPRHGRVAKANYPRREGRRQSELPAARGRRQGGPSRAKRGQAERGRPSNVGGAAKM